jgi:hypothetical protein
MRRSDRRVRVCRGDNDRSNMVNGILKRLDFHPLSIDLLAIVARQNTRDTNQLAGRPKAATRPLSDASSDDRRIGRVVTGIVWPRKCHSRNLPASSDHSEHCLKNSDQALLGKFARGRLSVQPRHAAHRENAPQILSNSGILDTYFDEHKRFKSTHKTLQIG